MSIVFVTNETGNTARKGYKITTWSPTFHLLPNIRGAKIVQAKRKSKKMTIFFGLDCWSAIREVSLFLPQNEKNKPNVSTIVNSSLSLHQDQMCMEKNAFRLILTNEAENFIESLPQPVADKIYYNIYRISKGERNMELFKKLDNTDIWEFRTLYNRIAYRLFAFWDKDKETLVIATHGIIKKSQKTPSKEIAKAETIRKQYFAMKNKNNK